MATPSKKLGLTPPLSEVLPTQAEIDHNNAMVDELRRQGIFETSKETEKRHKVLAALQEMCNEFVRRVALKVDEQGTLAKDARGKIFTYGGFQLGVYGPGSDIDTLVVAPKYVTRENYFDIFPNLLREMAPKGAITDLSAVTDAYVPIIKFEFWGISIDMIFSRIAVLKKLPSSQTQFTLQDNALLRGLDDGEIRSVNGTRVAHEILDLVPEISTFQMALRAIKLWAQRRAVYANVLGYPGGVAWAILLARVCQLYPKATSATVVNKFFHIVRMWPWPQPVNLKEIEKGTLGLRVWTGNSNSDKLHLMPIITPAYPSMNAAYNITRSSLSVIKKELERASQVSDLIMSNKLPWSELFEKHTFFTKGYKYYLGVVSCSLTKEAHKKWSGYIESKVRTLVQNLDKHNTVVVAQVFIKKFERVHWCNTDDEMQQVQQGSLKYVIKDDVDDVEDAKTNEDDVEPSMPPTKIYTSTHYIGLELRQGSKSINLTYEVNQFRALVREWAKFDTQLNCLHVQHLRCWDLPDDVFAEGEVKPQRKPKAQANGAKAANGSTESTAGMPVVGTVVGVDSKKRSVSEVDGITPPAKRQQQQQQVPVAI